jgi:hypothetical protein
MKTVLYLLVTTIAVSRTCSAFLAVSTSNIARAIPCVHEAKSTSVLTMVGGRGWDNSDYLSSLSGDEEDRNKSLEDYEDFSERRAEFNARQAERMQTPEAQAFLKRRQEQQFRQLQQEQEEGAFSNDDMLFGKIEEGSGGGTRMGQMMAQAKRMQGQRGKSNVIGGFQQQFLFPLDDDEEEQK